MNNYETVLLSGGDEHYINNIVSMKSNTLKIVQSCNLITTLIAINLHIHVMNRL